MNRLLQGDVGAGKTIVAIGAILMAIDSGMQAAMLAPTEILAVQHYHTLQNYLSPLDIDARLLVGGQKAADRKSTRLNSSHVAISYAVFCLTKKNTQRG